MWQMFDVNLGDEMLEETTSNRAMVKGQESVPSAGNALQQCYSW